MRGIPSWPERLRTEAEGFIQAVEGVLQVTRIHIRYRLKVPADRVEPALRALKSHPVKCPVHQTLAGCVKFELDWQVEETAPADGRTVEELRSA